MKNRELAQILMTDPDGEAELDIDIHRPELTPFEARQTRRIVTAFKSGRHGGIVIQGDGNLTPDEEKRLREGLVNREYARYESWWNALPSNSDKLEVLDKAGLVEAGIRCSPHIASEWSELPLRIQQMIMVRVDWTPAEVR